MLKRGKFAKPKLVVGNAYASLPLPGGVAVPMCFCGDLFKVGQSDEEDTYKQRYWMCANYTFDPPPCMIRIGLLVRMYIFVLILLMSQCKMYDSRATIECFADPSTAM